MYHDREKCSYREEYTRENKFITINTAVLNIVKINVIISKLNCCVEN